MSNGLLYIAGLLTLVLAALFAVPYFIDWNGYRGVFEEEATRILGREVRVGGNVNVRLLPAPFVRFENIRIADPTGNSGEPFIRADSFTMKLSVPPLLKGILEANEIELKRPVLRLALDAQGGGNWRSLSITPGSLPFVPSDVTLQSVRIKDGVVKLHGPKGIGFAEMDGLNGELKAESIDGPFSFKGTFGWKGSPRELRIATGAADASGAIRFKATVRGEEQADGYTVNGRVVDLKGRPRIEGDISAKFALDSPKASQHSGVLQQLSGAETPLADFRASFAGDAAGLRLDGITLTFEGIGQPQIITGSATASWADQLAVDLNLGSRWLDLDRISGSGGDQGPIEITRSFVGAVMEALPTQAQTDVRFDLDQANLGGEPVSGVKIEVVRAKGALVLKELRAGLPGGAKLALYGSMADGPAGIERPFQGDVSVRGTSLGRFLTWAVKDQAALETVRSDGAFALQGRLSMGGDAVDLTDAGAEIGGQPVTGEVHYRGGERMRLGVVLDGQEIDASRMWPAGVSYIKSLLAGGAVADAGTEPSARPAWLDAAKSDLSLRLRAGRLATGQQPLRDVDVDIAVEKGRLAMRSCKFVTDDGLTVDIEGDVANVTSEPRGMLHWVFAAPSKEAYTSLVRLWDLAEGGAAKAMAYAALAPMRIAGTITLGENSKTGVDIVADGSIQGGRVATSAHLGGGLAGWRDGESDVAVNIESSDVVRAFDALSMRPTKGPEPHAINGEIFLKAVGVPADGLLTTATVKAPGLFFAYDGNISLPKDGGQKFDGDLRISSRELADVLALGGLGSGGALRGVTIIGSIKMQSANHALELEPQQLAIADSKVDGTMALAYPADGPAIVTAQLKVDKASVPGLLSAVLDRGATAAVEAAPAAEAKSIWPESAFDFSVLDGIEGKLGVEIGALALEPGMVSKNVQLDVSLAPGKLSVSKLTGHALGGDILAAMAIERAPGGANLNASLQLTGAHLQDSAGASQGGDAGGAALKLELAGRGATPGGLIAVATGKGELTLGDMKMRVPTPLAVVASSEAVLNGAAGGSGDELVAALREKMTQGAVQVGPRTIPIQIADGAAQLADFTLPSPAGTTTVKTTFDLSSLMVDSTWVLEPKAPDIPQPNKPRNGALPSVNVVYVGPLKDAWSLEPRITADQLERELAIRKMEFDADQLEHLRKLDEERARRDAAQRATPPPGGPAPGPVPGPVLAQPPAPAIAAPAMRQPQPAQPAQPLQPIQPSQQALPQLVPQSNDPVAPVPLTPVPLGTTSAPTSTGVQVPGLEARIPPLDATGNPADGTDAYSNPADQATKAAEANAEPQASRPRRPARRAVPVGEQVLRALQNGAF
jgi:uncharacterized protein involved in outer membrane biogenesis